MTWNESLHPRDPRDGQFVERAGDWAGALSGRLSVGGNGYRSVYEADDPRRWPAVLRMVLRPEARVISHERVGELYDAWVAAGGRSPAELALYSDEGRFAAAMGYDAIMVRHRLAPDSPRQVYVILNRTAVVVQEAFGG